ncbi:MAG: TAT-variant-translocated molybdopterin oxidoreductase [Chloroflexaceae bacterium]
MTTNSDNERVDLTQIRERLAGAKGQQYWRSLEEVAETREFQEFLHREFPQGAAEWDDSLSRRTFLKIMGASLALAGLTSCRRQPVERIAPYTNAKPEQEYLTPGIPAYYASVATSRGYAMGVLVESHMGRPTFISGNPEHPASLGAADVFTQAELLTMYDPDRSQDVRQGDVVSSWDNFVNTIGPQLDELRAAGGAGLRILTQTVTSPTLASQMQALQEAFPSAQWHSYDPVGNDNVRQGAQLAFGEFTDNIYRFSQANVILSLDSNFLLNDPGSVRYAREFMSRRRVRRDNLEMNRLYVVESTPSITGSVADHRQPLRASEIEAVARVVAQRVGVADVTAPELPAAVSTEWIDVLVSDLQENQGAGLVLAGDNQPPVVHALAHAINQQLGNVGTTVVYIEPVEANPVNQTESLRELVTAMEAGEVQMLLIIGGNPVYDAPSDLDFGSKLANVGTTIHQSLFFDETSALATWHLPGAHFLESWSDALSFNGVASIVQPIIEPLYGGKSAHELVAVFLGQAGVSGYDIVRSYWQNQNLAEGDFETFWNRALRAGIVAGTGATVKSVSLQSGFAGEMTAPPEGQIEIMFQPDPTIWDGRFANNGWLQELPDPLTKLTWDNAALIGLRTAETLGLSPNDVVEVRAAGTSVRASVWILEGHPDNAVTVYLGHGRAFTGRVSSGVGFNAYSIRTTDAPWFTYGELRPTGESYALACTQDHATMAGRHLVVSGTLASLREDPEHPPFMPHGHEYHSIYPDYEYGGPHAWGMVVDLTACIGCNACTIACQAENNIPVVGKEQVLKAREMHWLRIDRYYTGDPDNPTVHFQPMMCVHCEKAPCEVVCPVAATVHDDEGINNMIYNRCVGTRYCSNNCPYKVRRFNFLQYTDRQTESLKLMRNPDVTVRNRGVMEKCTYCIQRIVAARIQANVENREINDGEVQTACQAACPTRAIVFGNLNDPESQVRKLKAEPLNYIMLEELNIQPRTTWLADVRNPHPILAPLVPAEDHGTGPEEDHGPAPEEDHGPAPEEDHGTTPEEVAPADGHGTE